MKRQGLDKNRTSITADNGKPRILLFSQRNILTSHLYRCPLYEFEDIICTIDSTELLAPQPDRWFDSRHRLAKRIAWRLPIALNPGLHPRQKQTDYDLFFAVCSGPAD